MPSFDPSTPTTELEAVNTMLAAIGEQPLASGTNLLTTGRADIDIAVDTLKKACRETLSAGWKFNTLYDFKVAPTTTFVWAEAGYSDTLNIFKKPAEFLSWSTSNVRENLSLDLIERPSLQYKESGLAVLVLFDRTYNRDGASSKLHPELYLDAITAVQFEQMPETARRFVAIRAARQFVQQVVGADSLKAFTQEDEMMALRNLKKDQGVTEKLNMLNTPETYGWAGGRPMPSNRPTRRVNRWY